MKSHERIAFASMSIVTMTMFLISTYKNFFATNPTIYFLIQTKLRDPPLLTIFTTFKDPKGVNATHHEFAHRLAVANWASFIPQIRPVLFASDLDSVLSKLAKESGWDVLPMVRMNSHKTPFLRDMYRDAFNRSNSTFYGFANGDLLFDNSLIRTLIVVRNNMNSIQNNVLMVGQRTNVFVHDYSTAAGSEFAKTNLKDLSTSRGRFDCACAIDYFFLSRSTTCSLRWNDFADVVIGRARYDNYFLTQAINHGVHTIDVTKTCLAVHLKRNGSSGLGFGPGVQDYWYNEQVIGKQFNYRNGSTTATELVTELSLNNDVYLIRRK